MRNLIMIVIAVLGTFTMSCSKEEEVVVKRNNQTIDTIQVVQIIQEAEELKQEYSNDFMIDFDEECSGIPDHLDFEGEYVYDDESGAYNMFSYENDSLQVLPKFSVNDNINIFYDVLEGDIGDLDRYSSITSKTSVFIESNNIGLLSNTISERNQSSVYSPSDYKYSSNLQKDALFHFLDQSTLIPNVNYEDIKCSGLLIFFIERKIVVNGVDKYLGGIVIYSSSNKDLLFKSDSEVFR